MGFKAKPTALHGLLILFLVLFRSPQPPRGQLRVRRNNARRVRAGMSDCNILQPPDCALGSLYAYKPGMLASYKIRCVLTYCRITRAPVPSIVEGIFNVVNIVIGNDAPCTNVGYGLYSRYKYVHTVGTCAALCQSTPPSVLPAGEYREPQLQNVRQGLDADNLRERLQASVIRTVPRIV